MFIKYVLGLFLGPFNLSSKAWMMIVEEFEDIVMLRKQISELMLLRIEAVSQGRDFKFSVKFNASSSLLLATEENFANYGL